MWLLVLIFVIISPDEYFLPTSVYTNHLGILVKCTFRLSLGRYRYSTFIISSQGINVDSSHCESKGMHYLNQIVLFYLNIVTYILGQFWYISLIYNRLYFYLSFIISNHFLNTWKTEYWGEAAWCVWAGNL